MDITKNNLALLATKLYAVKDQGSKQIEEVLVRELMPEVYEHRIWPYEEDAGDEDCGVLKFKITVTDKSVTISFQGEDLGDQQTVFVFRRSDGELI